MEDILKLAVNYGLGMLFSVGIAVTFFLYARDINRQSYSRELKLMEFMEKHSLVTQKIVEENITKQIEIARYQRQEHESIMTAIGLVKDSLNSLNNNIINQGFQLIPKQQGKMIPH